MERHQLPLVSFHWLLKSGGAVCDPPAREGLAELTAELLRKGTATRTANQVSESLDFVGATFDAGAAQEYAYGSAEFLSKDLHLAVDLLSDLLLHPAFPAAEVDKLAQQEIDGIKEAKAVPEQVIGRYFEAFVFGPHPYGRPACGTETTLANLTRADVAGFYQAWYVPNLMTLAVVGDFSAPELERRLRAAFASWEPRPVSVPIVPDPPAVQGRRALVVDKPDATQTFFRIGNVGLARTSADWVPLQVVNTLYGGRFTSMINTALRIESGLTYGAHSSFSSRRARGAFAIGSFTPNASTGQALDLALDTLRKLHQSGVTPKQLVSAKTYLTGQFGPTLETNDQLAALLVELDFYGLGRQYIDTYFERVDALTLPEARRLIKTYYPLDDLVFVFIGQRAVADPVAHKLAFDVQHKAITDTGW
jgi:predicted Zn-dependent peptidase